MLIRLVSMHFRAEACEEFLNIFNQSAPLIRAFSGCLYVELLRDQADASQFYTYSYWENEEAIEAYRNSELFQTTWSATKVLFDQKPTAKTLCRVRAEK